MDTAVSRWAGQKDGWKEEKKKNAEEHGEKEHFVEKVKLLVVHVKKTWKGVKGGDGSRGQSRRKVGS